MNPRFADELKRIGLDPQEDQLEALAQFEASLYEWNEVMNLTRVDREECWLRHFLDSVLMQEFIPAGASVCDLGTGPGFPAFPLAVLRPDLVVTAVDSSGKMLGFLARHPLPNLDLQHLRAEEWGRTESFDVVTGRAIAPLSIQLELSVRACKVGGMVMPMRTPNEEFENGSYANQLFLEFLGAPQRELAGTDIVRAFPMYRKLRPTPERYPRRWAEIRAKPL